MFRAAIHAPSSARDRIPSLPYALARRVSTVFGLTYAVFAISRLVCPPAASSAIRSSVSVSSVGAARNPDPGELGSRALRPQVGAHRLEDGRGLFERVAGEPLLGAPAMDVLMGRGWDACSPPNRASASRPSTSPSPTP
jgi:hypothetical protein